MKPLPVMPPSSLPSAIWMLFRPLFPTTTGGGGDSSLNTGLRRGELAGLRWAQVDLEARPLTVGKSKTEAGAGRKVPLNERAFAAPRHGLDSSPFVGPST